MAVFILQSDWIFLERENLSEDYKINGFIKDYFTVIYTCYIWLESLLNSEHFFDTKSKQIIYANRHGNQQSHKIYTNMQIEIRIFMVR